MTISAQVFDLEKKKFKESTVTANQPGVVVVNPDGSNVGGSGGGGTQYADGAARGTATGTIAMVDDGTNIQSMSGDSSGRANVNLISGQTGVQGGSGTVSATTQRVVLATDVALPAGSNAIGKLAANSGVDIGDVDVTSLPALVASTAVIGIVDINRLVWISSSSTDVDNSSIQVFDCSAVDSTTRYITICNAGDGDLFVRIGGSAPVADGSTAYYDFKLAKGETRWMPFGYKSGSTLNDVYVVRSAAQTNDNVIVSLFALGGA